MNFSFKQHTLFNKLQNSAKIIGRKGLKPILILYFVMKSPYTPKKDKLIIMTALGYLILPINLLSSKRLPIIGWADELAAIMITYKKMKRYITPEIENKTNRLLDEWLPEYTDYETIIH